MADVGEIERSDMPESAPPTGRTTLARSAEALRLDPDPTFRSSVGRSGETIETVKDDYGALHFKIPEWLKNSLPVDPKDKSAEKIKDVLCEDCCLWDPLGYCGDYRKTINGQCAWHQIAVFNLRPKVVPYYLQYQNEPKVIERKQMLVADPQHINNGITAVFPIVEFFDKPITPADIKLHRLRSFLRNRGSDDWQKIYDMHVNFLHQLITVRSRDPVLEIEKNTQQKLMIHWDAWNKIRSQQLNQSPQNLYLTFLESSDIVKTVSLDNFTTITQMVVRFFEPSFTSLDDQQHFSTVPNYGIYIKNHLAFQNNLCSAGTVCTEGRETVGNAATLSIIRRQKSDTSLLINSVKTCPARTCITKKLNPNDFSLFKDARKIT